MPIRVCATPSLSLVTCVLCALATPALTSELPMSESAWIDEDEDFDICPTSLLQLGVEVFAASHQNLHQVGRLQPAAPSLGAVTSQLSTTGDVTSPSEQPDLAFAAASALALGAVLAASVIFVVLQPTFPHVYSYNEIIGRTLRGTPQRPWGWLTSSYACKVSEFHEIAGLDAAMQVEMLHLGLRIMLAMSIPSMLIILPMHLAAAASQKHSLYRLTWSDISPVDVQHAFGPEIGMATMFADALVLGICTVTSVHLIFQAHESFRRRRYLWLSERPPPEASTLMVENIPREFRSDVALKELMNTLAPDACVSRAYVVKRTGKLPALVYQREAMLLCLQRAEEAAESCSMMQAEEQSGAERLWSQWLRRDRGFAHYREKMAVLDDIIIDERARISREARDPANHVCSSCGFVTFAAARDAEHALTAIMRSKTDGLIVSYPPEPGDIIYSSLEDNTTTAQFYKCVGSACLLLVLLAVVVCIAALSAFTDLASLRRSRTLAPLLTSEKAHARGMVEGVACPAVMTLVLVALAPLLRSIFRTCYCLKSHAWSQRMLHSSYTAVICSLVLVVVPVASATWRKAEEIAAWPDLANGPYMQAIPGVAMWFMCFLAVQSAETCVTLLRSTSLVRFLWHRRFCGDELGRRFSEPESQDLTAHAVRAAKSSLSLAAGILFSVVCPPITVVCIFDLALRRGVDGYLLCFSESKKTDLGGGFWETQINTIFVALVLQGTLMMFMLYNWRDAAEEGMPFTGASLLRNIPWILAAMCIGYVCSAWLNFQTRTTDEPCPVASCPSEPFCKVRKSDIDVAKLGAMLEVQSGPPFLHTHGSLLEEGDAVYAQREMIGSS